MKHLFSLFFSAFFFCGCGGGSGVGCAGVGCGPSSASPPPSEPPPPSAVATHFVVTSAASAASGTPITVTVAALDASANVVSGYTGTVHFASSDSRALLPPNSQLSSGSQSFSVTLQTTGSQSISVLDAATLSISGRSSPIDVVAAGSFLEGSGPLPNGKVGLEYGALSTATSRPTGCSVSFFGWQMRATGGVAPYTFSWAAAGGSSLPSGLIISTARNTCGGSTRCCTTVTASFIGGTPTVAGSYKVIVTVSDSASPPAHASATYTLVVNKSQSSSASPVATETRESPAPEQLRYKLVDLSALGDSKTDRFARAGSRLLNNQGRVIGTVTLPGGTIYHAFVWSDARPWIDDLGTLGGDNSQANWINDLNEIAGVADLPGGTHHAVIWKDEHVVDLGAIAGDSCSTARAINSQGQVVGESSNCGKPSHAFLWEAGAGHMVDLNSTTLVGSGFLLTDAFYINDRGEILAEAAPNDMTPAGDERASHTVLLLPCKSSETNCQTTEQARVATPTRLQKSSATNVSITYKHVREFIPPHFDNKQAVTTEQESPRPLRSGSGIGS